ncbi:non-ribosomal peptide synthetase [Paenibacillus campi]|uniref:non-ribosomal peptide synthetase n=1 Tax=Paenibacillus campi TaxID=3106031 RepID=UPI002AFDD58D|nr:non-ribosomal peptide synthetase [Paenibacillus sp. SGZ-1009]
MSTTFDTSHYSFPASFAQRRIWFVQETVSDPAVYHVPLLFKLTGHLYAEVLQHSIDRLVERHESLRTYFAVEDSEIMQRIVPELKCDIQYGVLPNGDMNTVEQRMLAHIREPFSLEQAPLFRVYLDTVHPTEHYLLLNMHHIVTDGWSCSILLRELSIVYRSELQGIAAPLPELDIQVADFAQWQKDYLQGEQLEQQLRFWEQHLQGELPVLDLPVPANRPLQYDNAGATFDFRIASDLTERFSQLCSSKGTTLYIGLLAVYQVLLARVSGQHDIVVGTPIANRNHPELEPIVGMFVNTMALRTNVQHNPTFVDLLLQVRTTMLEAYDHQDVPFDLVVERLAPERHLGQTPIFQAMFAFQNDSKLELDLTGLTIQPVDLALGTAKFELYLDMMHTEDGLYGIWEYQKHLYDQPLIAQLTQHFVQLIEQIVNDEQQRIWHLPVYDAQMVATNEPESSSSASALAQLVHVQSCYERFEYYAKHTPDKLALRHQGTSLTYTQLNEKANGIAAHLLKLGIPTGAYIALWLEPSAEAIASLLAIWKVGGCCVPLHAAHPAAFNERRLQRTGVHAVITNEYFVRHLSSLSAHIVCLEQVDDCAQQGIDPNRHVAAHQAAYMYWTAESDAASVVVPHYRLLRMNELATQAFTLEKTDVWAWSQPLDHELALWEIGGALFSGATLVIVPDWMYDQPQYVLELVQLEKVTRFTLGCHSLTTWMSLADRHEQHKLALKTLFITGKTITVPSMQTWLERHNVSSAQLQLVHIHSVRAWGGVISYRTLPLDGNRYERTDRSIGVGLESQPLYVLDQAGQMMPPGIAGTLHIGEWDCPAATVFHAELSDARWSERVDHKTDRLWLYRTDDYCRLGRDGQIEWLYNKQDEIELNGSPLPLPYIHEVCLNMPQIREVMVEVNAAQMLIAFVVVQPGAAITMSELQYRLGEQLPEHWIPRHIYTVERLPEKSNKRRLPSPHRSVVTGTVQPTNETEKKLVHIWQQVLQVEQLGIQHNYFACGGDSIRMLSMIALAKEHNLHLSIKDILSYQTIQALAPHVTAVSSETVHIDVPYDLITATEQALLPDDVEEAYPLTQMQQGMLFQNELHPHAKLYHDLIHFSIHGHFEQAIWEQALQRLMERHAVLRTTFDLTHYRVPLQLVHTQGKMLIHYVDERHHAEDEQHVVRRWVDAEMNTPFDWSQALLRVRIVQVAEDHIYMMLVMHHAILDGWSVAHFTTEWFETVDRLLQGQSLQPLVPLQSSFKQHVREEQLALQAPEQRDYWKQALDGFARTVLPRWRLKKATAPAMQLQDVEIPAALSLALRELAQTTMIPLKSWLIAVHMQVLKTITNEQDITSGVLFHGRPQQTDGDRILGLFLNTLPFRLRLDGGSWRSIAQQAWETEKDMLQHRHYPMAQIQHDIGGEPLFETFFNFTHFYVSEQKLGSYHELRIVEQPGYADNSFPFGAEFSLEGEQGELRLALRWDQSLFDDEQIRRLAGYYLQALHYAAHDTDTEADRQSLLTAAEQAEINSWNETARLFPRPHLLHTLFEQQAACTPDNIAIMYRDQQLSYRECNEQANRIAHYLRKHGLDTELKAGVCLERSAELPLVLMAILKAGGAYVPFDPQHPVHYMEEIVQDAAPTLIITNQQSAALFARYAGTVLDIEQLLRAIDEESCENLELAYNPGQLAYMIYTSGSTGKPKGVLIEHKAIANRLLWMQEQYQLSVTDRILQKTPFTFDVSVWEFFWPLMTGAGLVMAEPDGHKNPQYLLDTICQYQITIVHFVPSMLHAFLAQPGVEQCSCLQKVICSGEALSPALQQQFFARLSCELHNLYGPTEAAVDVTSWACRKGDTIVPIGMPIANVYIRVLNQHGRRVGVGVPGELYIGGVCLARGYHNRPELNAERFIADPFSDDPAARLYKTGDQVKYLTNGAIEYLGRFDHQVKIRGFRIELGDIEAKLATHPHVAACALCTIGDADHIQLIACIVPQLKGDTPDIDELYEYLKLYMPHYMIPSRWIWLDNMPVTTSGKIDRKALAHTAMHAHPEPAANYRAASSWTEHQLLKLWEQLLGVQVPGVNESFFHWGGHSLLAIQLVAHIEQQFGKKLPLSAVLEHPTVERLALLLTDHSAATPSVSELIALRATGSRLPLFCIHPVGGSAMCYHTLPDALGADQPVYAIQDQRLYAHEAERVTELTPVSIKQLAAQYIQSIRTIQSEGPYSLLGWSFGGVVAHEMACQLVQAGDEVAHLVLLDSRVSQPHERLSDYASTELKQHFLHDLHGAQQLDVGQDEKSAVDIDYTDEQTEHFYRLFLSNYQAMIEHTPQRFAGTFMWIGAQYEGQALERAADWQPYAERIDTIIVAADHYSMMTSKHVKAMVSHIMPYISETKE